MRNYVHLPPSPTKPSTITLANMAGSIHGIDFCYPQNYLRERCTQQHHRARTNTETGVLFLHTLYILFIATRTQLLLLIHSWCISGGAKEKKKNKPFLTLSLPNLNWDSISASSPLALCPDSPASSPEIHLPALMPVWFRDVVQKKGPSGPCYTSKRCPAALSLSPPCLPELALGTTAHLGSQQPAPGPTSRPQEQNHADPCLLLPSRRARPFGEQPHLPPSWEHPSWGLLPAPSPAEAQNNAGTDI